MPEDAVKQKHRAQAQPTDTSSVLDGPLTVLYEMTRLTFEGERIWFGKLFKNLKGTETSQGEMDGKLFFSSINALFDSEAGPFIERYTGETAKSRAGFLYRITDAQLGHAKDCYLAFLQATGAKKPEISPDALMNADLRREEFSDSRYLIDRLKHAKRGSRISLIPERK